MVLSSHSIGMAGADTQTVRRADTDVGQIGIYKQWQQRAVPKGQKHAVSRNGERNVQNPQNMTKTQPRKACGAPFRHKFPALRDPTSVATYDSSTHPNELKKTKTKKGQACRGQCPNARISWK
jgi:hypothetical protein